jgi:hypothetical protein
MFGRLRLLYWYLYNKLAPLPSDEVLSAKLREILDRANVEAEAQTAKKPGAGPSCCVVTFDGGSSVCSPDIQDQPTCNVWAASFDRPGTGFIFAGACPPSSSRIVRK